MAQSDDCRIVIASRSTLSEAQGFARSTSTDLPTLIYKAPNGFYAVATDTKRGLTGPESLRFLKSNGDIPNDSFCSNPAGFKFIATGETATFIDAALAWAMRSTLAKWIGGAALFFIILLVLAKLFPAEQSPAKGAKSASPKPITPPGQDPTNSATARTEFRPTGHIVNADPAPKQPMTPALKKTGWQKQTI